jgi:hypothetical protein
MASEALIIRQTRVSRDTPSIDALTIVAAFVRLRALDILFTPALAFAIVFKVRTSSLDHARRTTFFLANFNSSFERERSSNTRNDYFNQPRLVTRVEIRATGRVGQIEARNMTGEQSRGLKVGDRVCWGEDEHDQATVTEKNWSGVALRWDNRSEQPVLHNDMAMVFLIPKSKAR